MSNIEEDIDILEKFNPGDEYTEKIKRAIENILLEQETDKKRIKELEEENKSKQKAYDNCYCEYKQYKQFDSIPVQKVKDKIEELKERKHNLIYTQPLETIKRINAQIKILQELLEDK